jgi:hypothetical protein
MSIAPVNTREVLHVPTIQQHVEFENRSAPDVNRIRK